MPVPFNKAIYLSVAQKAASTQKCCCAIPTSKPTCNDISRSANAAAAVEFANLFHTITEYDVGSVRIPDGGADLYDGYDGRSNPYEWNANSWTVNGALLNYKDNGNFGNVGGQEYSMDIVTDGLSVVLFDNAASDILLYGPNNNMGADGVGKKYSKNFNHRNWSVHIDVITVNEAPIKPSHMVVVLVDRLEGVKTEASVAPLDVYADAADATNTDFQDIKVTGALGARVIYLQGALSSTQSAPAPEPDYIINALNRIATSVIDIHYYA